MVPGEKPRDFSPEEVARRYAELDEQGRKAVIEVLEAEAERRRIFDRWLDGVGDELHPLPTSGK